MKGFVISISIMTSWIWLPILGYFSFSKLYSRKVGIIAAIIGFCIGIIVLGLSLSYAKRLF